MAGTMPALRPGFACLCGRVNSDAGRCPAGTAQDGSVEPPDRGWLVA